MALFSTNLQRLGLGTTSQGGSWGGKFRTSWSPRARRVLRPAHSVAEPRIATTAKAPVRVPSELASSRTDRCGALPILSVGVPGRVPAVRPPTHTPKNLESGALSADGGLSRVRDFPLASSLGPHQAKLRSLSQCLYRAETLHAGMWRPSRLHLFQLSLCRVPGPISGWQSPFCWRACSSASAARS